MPFAAERCCWTGCFFDESAGPEHPDQLILFKQVSTIPNQQEKGVESLRCERHDLITPEQGALGGIQAERSKFVEPQSLLARWLLRNGGRIVEPFSGGPVACFFAQCPSLDPVRIR
jgi:hypothetical protein